MLKVWLICVAWWAVLVGAVSADDTRITVVEAQAGLAAEYSSLLQRHLRTARIQRKPADTFPQPELPGTVYIAAGDAALRQVINDKSKAPVIGVLLPKSAYLAATGRGAAWAPRNMSAIFADPNPAVQLKLIKEIFQADPVVGVLYSAETTALIPEIRTAARDLDIELIVERVDPSDDVFKALAKVRKAKAILALPDNRIYNPDTLRTILLATYRRGQVLIGYSPGMVKAGALATVSCDLDAVAAETQRFISAYQRSGSLPPPRYCGTYELFLNERVAESLDVAVPSRESLLRAIQRDEGKEK